MAIYTKRAKLGQIELDDEIVLAVAGDDDGASIIQTDSTLTKNSTNPVQSKGIWDKLSQLSAEIRDLAFAADEHSNEYVAYGNENPVRGGAVWLFCRELSAEIRDLAFAHDLSADEELTKTGTNVVKSHGIYNALTALSSMLNDKINALAVEFDNDVTKDSLCAVTSNGIWRKLDSLSVDTVTEARRYIKDPIASVMEYNSNAVKSSGIYNALSTLSDDIKELAYSHDLIADNYVTETSPNAVKSTGIYNALSTLSDDVIAKAYSHDLIADEQLTETSPNAVKSTGIYNALSTLSDDILLDAYSHDLIADEQLTETSPNAVKSSGIYNALSTLSDDIKELAYSHDLTADEKLTKDGTNPVQSKGIWEFAEELSNNIKTELAVPALDISLDEESHNGVENQAITKAINDKLDKILLSDIIDSTVNQVYGSKPEYNGISLTSLVNLESTEFKLKYPPLSSDQIIATQEYIISNTEITDDYVTETSPNAVKSSGIYNALSNLSDDIKELAYSHDLIADDYVTETSPNAVKSKGIYNALSTLSDDMLDEQLSETSQNAVRSYGIYNVLSSLSSLLNGEITTIDDKIELALNALDLVDQFVVTRDKVYYYNRLEINVYETLYEALNQNPEFGINSVGKIKIAEDLVWNAEDYSTSNLSVATPTIRMRKLLFNLDNHKITSNCTYMMAICDNAEVEIMNGSFYAESRNGFFLANGGKLTLKNVDVTILDNAPSSDDIYFNMICVSHSDTTDVIYDNDFDSEVTTGVSIPFAKILGPSPDSVIYRTASYKNPATNKNKTYIKTFTADANTQTIERSRCEVYVDRFSTFKMLNCHHDYNGGIWAFGPYQLCMVCGNNKSTYANGLTFNELQPYIEFNGRIELIYNDETIEDDTILSKAGYGTYTLGSDKIGVKIIIGSTAEIFVNHGHGLFCSNQNSELTVNGGKVVGSNGITMRAGHLNIPRSANPTIIGIGDYAEYDPQHVIGNAGSGLFIGNAVFIEQCVKRNQDTSYGSVYPNIESGNFQSKNNTTIGSYANAADGTKLRQTKFVSGGTLNRIPTNIPYDYATGHYSDYDIIADGYVNSVPTMIIKENLY